MWDNTATEWYYDKMRAGETHIPVNAANFMERIQHLQDNDTEVKHPANQPLVGSGGKRRLPTSIPKKTVFAPRMTI